MAASSYLPPPFNQIHQIGAFLKLARRALRHRGELAMLELVAARAYLVATILLFAGAGVLALIGGFSATLTLAAFVWESPHRTLILGLTTLGFFAISTLTIVIALRRFRRWQPLKETRQQLQQDADCLIENLPGNTP